MISDDPRYLDWIAKYLTATNPYGQCHYAAALMQAAFPELAVVPGHVDTLSWGRRDHVWLTTPSGFIVDPTASQFPAIIRYDPWKPWDPVRVGRCMNCGDDIWKRIASLAEKGHSACTCSDECRAELTREYCRPATIARK